MSISEKTKRLLLARSGGFCANPKCHCDLFPFFESKEITNVEELAHIIGQSEKGPRGEEDLELSQRDEYANIILLCPTCHTIIDKNSKLFPLEVLLKWKENHQNSIENIFNLKEIDSREELKKEIDSLLSENHSIFNTYGPTSDFAKNVISSAVKTWHNKSVEIIVPNNRKIIALLIFNKNLLNKKDKQLLEEFKLHKDGFEYNKLSGDRIADYPLFPKAFITILD